MENGDPTWLAVAVGCEIVSFAGYVVLTRAVHRPRAPRLDGVSSTELTLGGVVATRVSSAGGAGGIAFTGWVLHRAGMSARTAAMARRSGAIGRLAARLAPVPQVAANGARLALSIARENRLVLLSPVVWWAFDVATLWACFHAFAASRR